MQANREPKDTAAKMDHAMTIRSDGASPSKSSTDMCGKFPSHNTATHAANINVVVISIVSTFRPCNAGTRAQHLIHALLLLRRDPPYLLDPHITNVFATS